MKSRTYNTLLSAALLASVVIQGLPAASRGADWPQWRGPERNGISKETGLLREWPKSGPKRLWEADDIGSGFAAPAVADDRIFVLGNRGLDDEFIQALSTENGERLWLTPLGKVGNPEQRPNYPAARSTPTIDGNRVYALGSDGDLVCLKASTGEVRWRRDLRTDFAGRPGEWAYAESPLVDGNKLVCTPGGKEATIVALNKKNGDVIWKSAVPGGDEAAYASIKIARVDGTKQYVQFLGGGVVGVNAKTGEFLWRYDKTAEDSPANIPTPVVHKDLIYNASARGGGSLLKLKPDQGKVTANQVYHYNKLPNQIGGAVRVGDLLYGTTGQALLCVELTSGNIRWEERSIAPASLLYADGHLYLHGENGDVALVEATPKAYREKGRFSPSGQPDRGRAKAWAYPALADGKLYIRDENKLWCYSVSQ